jgi:hypothetical protein
MKKALLYYITVFIMSILAYITVNAQTNKTFYYYPSQNVYYDVTGKQYLFNDGGTWTTVKTLPSGVVLTKGSPRVTVTHPGNDVWVNNSSHSVKYKGDKVKVKTKTNAAKPMNKGRSKKG